MPSEENFYSDEVREIMGRIPSWITRWGICIIGAILLLLLLGCYFIKYPKTVVATAVITTLNPPADLVARYDGRIEQLFVKDGEKVRKGEVVATLENTADYESVACLERNIRMTLGKPFSVTVHESWIAGNYQLGDIQADFAQYQSLAFEYKTYLSINLIGKKQNLIRNQITKNAAYAGQLREINGLVNKEMTYVRKGYERDSILYSTKTIATGDIEKSARTFLQGKQSKLSSDANITSAELQVMQSRQQLAELDMQRQNEIEEYERNLGKSRQELIAAIDKWKENYALIAPVAGKMTFINYWSNNQRITSGDRLASIVPDDNVKVIGRLSVPPSGFGKVKDGQRVLVALEGYPYMEFGKLSGIITSISAVPDKDNNYQVEVYFPEGLRTTYKKNISLIQQMKGTGEIITEDMRRIEQLINPIRSLFKNN